MTCEPIGASRKSEEGALRERYWQKQWAMKSEVSLSRKCANGGVTAK